MKIIPDDCRILVIAVICALCSNWIRPSVREWLQFRLDPYTPFAWLIPFRLIGAVLMFAAATLTFLSLFL